MEQRPTVGMRKGEYGALSIVRRVIRVASHLPVLQALLVTSVNTNHNSELMVNCPSYCFIQQVTKEKLAYTLR
jgi:hypothetical protein